MSGQNYSRWFTEWPSTHERAGQTVEVIAVEALADVPRITHGRHCLCSSCARQDWAESGLAPCGMHGSSCPPVYDPWGGPGDPIPEERVVEAYGRRANVVPLLRLAEEA